MNDASEHEKRSAGERAYDRVMDAAAECAILSHEGRFVDSDGKTRRHAAWDRARLALLYAAELIVHAERSGET